MIHLLFRTKGGIPIKLELKWGIVKTADDKGLGLRSGRRRLIDLEGRAVDVS